MSAAPRVFVPPSPSMHRFTASLALLAAGCITQPDAVNGEMQTNAATTATTNDGKPPAFASAGAPLDTESICSDDAKFVYVLSTDGDLYRFDPGKLAIDKLFAITWQSSSADPRLDFLLSMAVDRQGSAWVQYGNGQIWKVDVKSGACQKSSYAPAPTNRVFNGMAFVANSTSSPDTLFVSGGDPYQYDPSQGFLTDITFVASLDPVSLRSTPLGMISDTFLNGQVTGSGDGRLFAFYEDPPSGQPGTTDAKVAELDKASGRAKTPITLTGFPMHSGFATAFWGGDLWVFNGISDTNVEGLLARVAPATGKLDVMIPDVGFEVMGAGVSTCAPTTPVVK
jgi:hypothetical protein